MSRIRVLLVEDNPDDARLIQELLTETEPTQFQVTHIERLDELTRLLSDETFDLVMLDLEMADSSGLDMATRVCRQARYPALVALTNNGDDQLGVEAIRHGAQDYLSKGELTRSLLVRAVRYAIDRKCAQETLRESEERLRAIAEFSPDCIYWRAPDDKILYIAPACEWMTGYTPNAFHTSPQLLDELVHPADRHRWSDYKHAARSGDFHVPIELRIVTKPGQVRWLSHVCRPIYDDAGNFLGVRGSHRDITDRRRAELALRESEEQFRTVIDASKDAMIAIDQEGLITIFNPSAEEMFGRQKADMIGQPPDCLVPEELRCPHRQYVKDFFTTHKPRRAVGKTVELRALRSDGRVFPIELTLSAGHYGSQRFVLAVIRDISKRKQSDEQIHRQRAVVEAINRILGEALTCQTEEDVARGCLAAAKELTGSSCGFVGELNQAGLFDTIAISNPAWDACKMARSEATKLTKNMPIRGIDRATLREGKARIVNTPASHRDSIAIPDGHPPIACFMGIPLKHAGKTIGMIGLANKDAGYDLADQEAVEALSVAFVEALMHKRAELEVRRTQAEAKQLLESISSILISIDHSDTITAWNVAAEDAFRIEAKDAVGQLLRDMPIAWDRAIVAKSMSECRASNRSARLDDVRFTRADGTEGFLGITLSPVGANTDKPQALLLVAADITQRRILESQLTQAQKLESIGRLAAGIAHEINTPTQFVGDNVHFLQDAFGDLRTLLAKYKQLLEANRSGAPTSELVTQVDSAAAEADVDYLIDEIPKAVEQSLEGVDRVSRIVRSMKEFSHPGGDERQSVDLNRAIESTITVARNEWKYVADLTTDFDPSLPVVPCFVGEFNQVILNMIVNAAHAIGQVLDDHPGDRGTITVTTRRDGDWAEIRISDTGTGIPPENQSRIFDPFFTTKQVGSGTGQGLAIAHTVVVQKHGGSITVDSKVNQGTTFIIRLPIAPEGNSQAGAEYHERAHSLC